MRRCLTFCTGKRQTQRQQPRHDSHTSNHHLPTAVQVAKVSASGSGGLQSNIGTTMMKIRPSSTHKQPQQQSNSHYKAPVTADAMHGKRRRGSISTVRRTSQITRAKQTRRSIATSGSISHELLMLNTSLEYLDKTCTYALMPSAFQPGCQHANNNRCEPNRVTMSTVFES